MKGSPSRTLIISALLPPFKLQSSKTELLHFWLQWYYLTNLPEDIFQDKIFLIFLCPLIMLVTLFITSASEVTHSTFSYLESKICILSGFLYFPLANSDNDFLWLQFTSACERWFINIYSSPPPHQALSRT